MMQEYKNGRKDIRVDDHTGRPSTLLTDMNATRAKKLTLENKSNTWEIASITKKEEAEIAIRDWFQKQEPGFYCGGVYKHVQK
jgi:hypothetical protein